MGNNCQNPTLNFNARALYKLIKMSVKTLNNLIIGIALLFLFQPAFSQSINKEKMKQLDFLVGEWIGTSKIYNNGIVSKEGAAFEKISYKLDTSILVIELNTEFLQLQTIVNYNEKDQKYYYHRFSKDGFAIYPAEFKQGQLIVWKNDETRFFFTTDENGNFKEYGEQLINGSWIKIFEDTFINAH